MPTFTPPAPDEVMSSPGGFTPPAPDEVDLSHLKLDPYQQAVAAGANRAMDAGSDDFLRALVNVPLKESTRWADKDEPAVPTEGELKEWHPSLWEKFRTSDVGRRLLGDTDEERAFKLGTGGSPDVGVIDALNNPVNPFFPSAKSKAGQALLGYFLYQNAKALPDNLAAVKQKFEAGDNRGAWGKLLESGINASFTGLAAHGLAAAGEPYSPFGAYVETHPVTEEPIQTGRALIEDAPIDVEATPVPSEPAPTEPTPRPAPEPFTPPAPTEVEPTPEPPAPRVQTPEPPAVEPAPSEPAGPPATETAPPPETFTPPAPTEVETAPEPPAAEPTPAPVLPPPAAPTREPEPAPAGPDETTGVPDLRGAVAQIANLIQRGPVTKAQVADLLAPAYGGTMAQGKFDTKDLHDAIELAVNTLAPKYLHPDDDNPQTAALNVATMKALLDRLPTQTTRTAEMDRLQQFSTPPSLAYVANWAANLRPGDVVLEPSAGVGGLATFARAKGAQVIANELSPRRAELLRQLGLAHQIHTHNAEHLNAMLQPGIVAGTTPQPTAVVMNPPFSNAAKTTQSNTLVGGKHVEEALKLLPPGGRLVAIVGEGMAADRPAFKGWWQKIARQYNVRANIGVSGKEYAKYGTSFGNQLLVIDKNGPTPEGSTVKGGVEKVEDLIPLLERIRNERPSQNQPAQPAPPQPAGPVPPAGGEVRPGLKPGAPAQPGAPGPVVGGGAGSVQPGGENTGGLGTRPPAAGGGHAAPGAERLPERRPTREPGQPGGPSGEIVTGGERYPNTGVGSPADEFGAIYGPTLTPEQIARFKEQEGQQFPLKSPKGTTAILKVKPRMLWLEMSKPVGRSRSVHEVGVAYLKIRPDGTTVLDASKHGRPLDKQAADALIDFLRSTKEAKPVPQETHNTLENPAPEAQGGLEAKPEFTQADKNVGLTVEQAKQGQRELSEAGVFAEYAPQKIQIAGAKPHPTPLVEPTAMASVQPVDPKYSPKLPQKLITDGVLSDAQLENVVYAGQAHQTMLPNGERMGYFIGDGTGVGKGRQITAIFADNMNQGRKKHVWVSKSKGLINDAKRDLAALGIDVSKIIDFGRNGGREITGKKEGIAFVPYSSLRSGNPGIDPATLKSPDGPRLFPPTQPPKGETKKSRMHLLHDWLGPDFDGVIVFDEAHQAGNAIDVKGKRGVKEASAQGKMVLDVQKLYPKARVVYASATGATDVTNLSYADRLGIWGPGMPFETKQKFFEQIQSGGLSAMEIVARDLKSMGRYLARTLSFEGVTRRQLVHNLTPDQVKIYDDLSSAWQYVLQHRDDTMAANGSANSGKARGAANAAFYGAQQRFYNQLLTALQMPSIINDVKAELAKGNSAVMQVVNTNEATLGREIAEKASEAVEGDNYLEDLDLSPRDILLQYIDSSYPTTLYEPVTDENGNTKWTPVLDANKQPVPDPEAIRRKGELMDKMALLKAPSNPLEMILDTFGADNVAEVTGRSRRVVNKQQDDGTMKRVLEANRGEAQRKAEAQDFQDGKRRILVFSDAGGTGFSYHASRQAKNQQRRIHYLIQAGWRADTAMQGFGRTHRSDQASAPEYALASTDIKGHQRFISTIARRLSELGALTGGERKSAGGEMFSDSNNLENDYAEDAVMALFQDLHGRRVPGFEFNDVSRKLGYTKTIMNERTGERQVINTLLDEKTGSLNKTKIPTIQQFLNRVLALNVGEQNNFFEEFTRRMEQRIEAAKADGSYDPGTQTLKALSIRKVNDQVVYQHPDSTAQTRLVDIEHDQPVKLNTFADLKSGGAVKSFVTNNRSGKIYAVKDGPTRTLENGQVLQTARRIGPASNELVLPHELDETHTAVDPAAAEKAWNDQLAATPTKKTLRDTYVVGAFLPIWDRLKIPSPKIWRITTDNKESLLGAHVPPKQVPELRQRLSAGSGGPVSPEAVFRNILDRGTPIKLANGWELKRVRVAGEPRIEVTGVDWSQTKLFGDDKGPGEFGFTERIQWKPRFFVPTDEAAGIAAMGKILAKSPMMGAEEQHGMATSQGAAGSAGSAPAARGPRAEGPAEPAAAVKDLQVLRDLLRPQSATAAARETANLLRQLGAEKALQLARAERVTRAMRWSFDLTPPPINWKYDPTIPLPRNYEFISAIQDGDLSRLSPQDRAAAEVCQQMVDEWTDRVIGAGHDAAKEWAENYFPQYWDQPERAKRLFQAALGRRPLEGSKSFLKQRIYKLFTDGLEAGLKPADSNPIDFLLRKKMETEQFVFGRKFQAIMKEAGLLRFKFWSRSMPGYRAPKDPAFQAWHPPFVTVKEAFDAGMRDKALEVMERLKIPFTRKVNLGGRGQMAKGRWGYEAHVPGTPGTERIATKFGGPEFVIWHELGHALDSRYPDLKPTLMATEAQQHELDGLAAQRYAGEDPGLSKGYFHKDEEKMAVVLQAYLHAPELFNRIAPTVAAAWKGFREAHPELKIIDEIRPTLKLGEAEAQQPLAGMVKLGEWVLPEAAAQVVDNYLSPGLQRRAWFRGWREVQNFTSGVQLVGGFHLGFVTGEAPVNKIALALRDASLGHGSLALESLLHAPLAPITNIVAGRKIIREALTGETRMYSAEVEAMLKAGGRFSQDVHWQTNFTRRTIRALGQMLAQLNAPGLQKGYAVPEAIKALLNLPPAVFEQAMRPVMQYFVPAQKVGASVYMMGHEQAMRPQMTEEQAREILGRVWDSVDNRMGQMTYDNQMMNAMLKSVLMGTFRSFGWQEGKLFEGVGGAKDLAKLGWDAKNGRWTGISHRSAYLLMLPLAVGIGCAVATWLLCGKRPESFVDCFTIRTGEKDSHGNDVRINPATYMRDIVGYVRHPVDTVAHSLNPMFSMLYDLWQNRDFYNVQIRNPDDNLLQQGLADLKFIAHQYQPFFLTQSQNIGDRGGGMPDKLAAFFGFTPAPERLSYTAAQELASEIMGSGRDVMTPEKFDQKKQLADIVRKLRTGQAAAGLAELHAGLDVQTLDPNTMDIMLNRLKYTPLQFQVSHFTPDAALRVYRIATPAERAQLQPILLAKLARAKTLWPAAKVAEMQEVLGIKPASKPAAGKN